MNGKQQKGENMKWYTRITAQAGYDPHEPWKSLLVGGIKAHTNGPFETAHDAQMFLITAIETNEKAGRLLDLENCYTFER